MRIAQVNAYYAPTVVGGAEVVVQTLAEGLAAQGHHVEVFCTSQEPGEDRVGGVPVHRLGHFNSYWPPAAGRPGAAGRAAWHLRELRNPRAGRALAEAVARMRPDVVHLHNLGGLSASAYGALSDALPGVPLVHTQHDYWLACVAKTLQDKRGRPCREAHPLCRARRPLMRAAVRGTLAAPSRAVADNLRAYGVDRPIRHVPNGVVPRARPRAAPADDLRLAYVGQLVPQKGVLTLADAVDSLGKGVSLEVMGAGPLQAEVARRAAGRWQVRGRVTEDEKWEALARADVLVVPSRWPETSSLVIMEAMHAGLGVVASDVGAFRELVQDGVNGRLVPPGDARALAAALEEVRADAGLRRRWGEESRRLADRYDAATMTRAYAALYEELRHGAA